MKSNTSPGRDFTPKLEELIFLTSRASRNRGTLLRFVGRAAIFTITNPWLPALLFLLKSNNFLPFRHPVKKPSTELGLGPSICWVPPPISPTGNQRGMGGFRALFYEPNAAKHLSAAAIKKLLRRPLFSFFLLIHLLSVYSRTYSSMHIAE